MAGADACHAGTCGPVHVCLDDDGVLLQGIADTHQGLVLAGFGVGHVSASMVPCLGGLADRMPVVLASRTGSGPVLDPYKARVLLRLLLALGTQRAEVAHAFAIHG